MFGEQARGKRSWILEARSSDHEKNQKRAGTGHQEYAWRRDAIWKLPQSKT